MIFKFKNRHEKNTYIIDNSERKQLIKAKKKHLKTK